MKFFGKKLKKFFVEELSKFIPDNIETYVEPFAGTFSVACYLFEERLEKSPKKFIYNDINDYNFTIYADKVHHLDYKEIFKLYDSENTVFYLDPPYYKKEFLYDGCEEYTEDFHIELKEEIDKLKGIVVLSYFNDKFTTNLYKDYNIHKCSGKFKNELIITKKASN
jgi:site-specific DNA-adenine methylase